jgi:hypothetical protein
MATHHLPSVCIVLIAGMSCLLPARDVTFLSTSDSHYREPDHRLGHHNHLNRAAYRMKSGVKTSKTPDGKTQRTWDGGWEWKWLLDKNPANDG